MARVSSLLPAAPSHAKERRAIGWEERTMSDPSPEPVALVTLIKLQKATKHRNKDGIKAHSRKAGDGSSQSCFLAISTGFIIFFSLGNTLIFNNFCETVILSRREQRSALGVLCSELCHR